MTASPAASTSRWKAVACGLVLALFGLVIWDGASRRPAEATRPLLRSMVAAPTMSPPATLKLASFNIHSGKGTDGVRNLSRTADLLNDVDFAGLYEVRALSDANQPNQAAVLAALQQANWLFAATERQWWADHFGNGLMYRIPVPTAVRIPLVNTRGKAFRNAILSRVELKDAVVQIIAVHIDRENDRRHQLQTVIELFLGLQEPCLMMGDLNTTLVDPLLSDLHARPGVHSPLHDAQQSSRLDGNIDWIFTRGLSTISASLVENTASDHPCLRVELQPTKNALEHE